MTAPLHEETGESVRNRKAEIDRLLARTHKVKTQRTKADEHNERISSIGLASLFGMETVE